MMVTGASAANPPNVIRYRAAYEAQQDKILVPINSTYPSK